MQNSKIIGNKIVNARKQKNLSQAQLAQEIAISPQAVGKWERGESLPDITTLQRLAKIFEVDLNFFSESFKPNDISENQSEFGWDMSTATWIDTDFSGINNLTDKLNECNLKSCKFIGSDLSKLKLKSNKVVGCDFINALVKNSKVQTSTISKSDFIACSLENAAFAESSIKNCNLTKSNLSGTKFLEANFQGNIVEMAIWNKTSFKSTGISDISFDGTLEGCSFEDCSFKAVKFQNVTMRNTFFKHNRKLNRVQFVDCKVDKATYAFLKNEGANLEGIKLID
ncbi:pentapeptide repeat-containing protein [Cesiribacter sp. SM1]|uniref:helix-turn-helix domain-containing protein n=1 Tax=Cesiribacter sp. SM1 TaxID=2861196 RepID=UPI001CD332E7|nr:pentapeptide repeat-containing protein [Cesiribacter sp. SM1]